MAVLKKIQFGNVSTPIAMTQVAIETESQHALSVTATNNGLDDDANPLYTIALAVDGQTITKTGANGLATALALKFEAAAGEGASATPARIVLADQGGESGYNVLSSVNVEDLVGSGMVESATYNSATGELTIEWVGSGSDTVINLGALLDIEDIVIKNDSTDYLSFAAVSPDPSSDAGQAQIGVKLADVTYTATSGNTPANLTVDSTNGKMLDATDAIPAIKGYVDDVLANANTNLAVTAEGDDYVSASVDAATDNKHVVVATNVQDLTATAGTPGVYGADGSQTTAPVAGTLSGTADSLGDAADIAEKVKTYVDGAIAIEAARSDAKNLADIAALDYADTAVSGQFVTEVDETDGVISVTRANLTDAVLVGYVADSTKTGAIAATDTLEQALNKLENGIAEASAEHSIVEAAQGNTHVTVTPTTAASGQITYTIGEDDIASAEALEDEVERAQAAEGEIAGLVGLGGTEGERTFTPTTNYGGSSANVAANLQALDTALDALADSVGDMCYSISGTTLILSGIPHCTAQEEPQEP